MTAMSDNKKAVLRQCYIAFALSGMGSLMVGSLLPFLRDAYGLNYAFSGMLLSAQPVGNLISTLLAGVLPLYIGRRRTVLILTIWMPVAYLLFALTSSPPLLLAACFFTGLARGSGANFSNVVVSTLAGETPSALNLLHGAFALGAFSAPFLLLLANLALPASGFRLAALCMAALAAIQFSFYFRASRHRLPEQPHTGLRHVSYRFLLSAPFWSAGLILLFYISAEHSITGWLVTYMTDSGIVSGTLAQMTSSILWICILAGRLASAAISRTVSRNILLIANGIGFFGFFLLLFYSTSAPGAALSIAGLGFFMAGIYPTVFSSVTAELSGNDFASSLLMLLGSLGGIIAPALIGYISESAGIAGGMRTVIVLTTVTCALILFRSVIPLVKARAASRAA